MEIKKYSQILERRLAEHQISIEKLNHQFAVYIIELGKGIRLEDIEAEIAPENVRGTYI